MRNFRFCAALLAGTAILFTAETSCCQIAALVSRVSEAQYRTFHLGVENMGLGFYGGPAFNMGVRNRDGWAGDGTLGNQEARLYLQDHFAGLGLDVSTQGIFRNVVGELPGTTTPDQIFVVGAHYDHIAGNRPGGDDNASGTAGILEAARILSQFEFDATIRFVGFNAEEDGLLGSADYVQHEVLSNGENVRGMVNLDMILRPAWDLDSSQPIDLDLGTKTTHPPSVAWAQKFRQSAATHVPSMTIDNHIFSVNGGSDQHPFVSNGIPAFLAIENTAAEIFGGANVYYHGYHDATDRLANDPNSPSGVTYDYSFATDVVRTVVALIAEEAGLISQFAACDFDANGFCDVRDLNALLDLGPVTDGVPLAVGVTDIFDLNGDAVIDNDDVDQWLAAAASSNGFARPYQRGDANLDGTVDGVDFLQWQLHRFSPNLQWDRGDFNGDGVTDGSDFVVWNTYKFTSSEGQQQNVPEPGALWLLVMPAALAYSRRARGRGRRCP